MFEDDTRKPMEDNESSWLLNTAIAGGAFIGSRKAMNFMGYSSFVSDSVNRYKAFSYAFNKVIEDNEGDLVKTFLETDGFSEIKKIAEEETVARIKNPGVSMRKSKVIDSLLSAANISMNPNRLLRDSWYSDSAAAAFNFLDSKKGQISEAAYSILKNNINRMVRDPNNLTKTLGNLNRGLSEDFYNESVEVAKELSDFISDWKNENTFKNWKHENEDQLIRNLSSSLFNIESLYKQQEERKKSLGGKISNYLDEDRKLTVKDIVELKERGEGDLIASFFSHDSVYPSNFEDDLKLFGDKIKINKDDIPSKDGTRAVRFDDLVTALYNDKDGLTEQQRNMLGALEIDNIYINSKGKIYYSANNAGRELVEKVGKTFPFSMFHGNEILRNMDEPDSFEMIRAGSIDPGLMYVLGEEGDTTRETYYRVNDRIYKMDGGNLVEIEKARGQFSTINTDIGVAAKTNRTFAGKAPYRDTSEKEGAEGFLTNKLGLNIHKNNRSEAYGNNIRTYGKFTEEALQDILATYYDLSHSDVYSERYKRALSKKTGFDNFIDYLRENTRTINPDAASRILKTLREEGSSANSIKYLELLEKLDRDSNFGEVMDVLLKTGSMKDRSYLSDNLVKLLRTYQKNPDAALKSYNTRHDPERVSGKGYWRSVGFKEMLQESIAQEFMLRYKHENKAEFEDLIGLFDRSLYGAQLWNAKDLATVTELKERTSLINSAIDPFLDEEDYNYEFSSVARTYENLHKSTNSNDIALRRNIERMANRFNFEEVQYKAGNLDYVIYSMPKTAHLPKSQMKQMIKHMNDGVWDKAANSAYNTFIGQFIGGAGQPKNYTAASMGVSHLLLRLNDMLNGDIGGMEVKQIFGKSLEELTGVHIGLGLHPKDMTTNWAFMKNLTLKRALPAYLLYEGYDLANDIAKQSTSMGIEEAGRSGLANVKLAVKKVTGATGLDSALKSLSKDNLLFNYVGGYFGGDGEWDTYEEQLEEYRYGYDAVRKSRYWTFGSSNEFRGGRISYWEPNALRKLGSDYELESKYNGSLITKWNIPYHIVNPYWMEDLHSEDRPYPISGPMFNPHTPWGVIGNATIGNVLKPQIELHQDRIVDGMDIKALIYSMNMKMRDKAEDAKNNGNLFYVQNGKLRSVVFNSYNAPTWSEKIVTVNNSTTLINNYQDYGTGETAENPDYLYYSQQNIKDNLLTFRDKLTIEMVKSGSYPSGLHPSKQILKSINENIYNKALDSSQGVALENKFQYENDAVTQMLEDSETIEELMNAGTTADYVQDMAVSARMITGLYGYGLNKAFGFGENNGLQMATSADMNSLSREFWDSGLGGLGGEQMEVIRRFISPYRRFEKVNPLMNNMPDWLPSRFRFGDPMTSVPDGEARMPGRGYEALNGLHPDMFGEYGAYDRYKILADIAPYSPEYKFWKKVASKTVTDPELKKDMKRIQKRVQAQTKQFDTFEYKYVGRDVERRSAYVTEVLDSGKFKIFGSDQVYKLAGVTIKSNENETREQVLNRYLAPGTKVMMVTDANEVYGRNRDVDNTINAGIVINGESLAEIMKANGDAVERKSDVSVAAVFARHGSFVNTINWIVEALGHADIPIIHSRWFRADTALERYKDDYIYGTAFQSWDDIWGTMVLPNMQKAASSTFWTGAGIVTSILYNNLNTNSTKRYNLIHDMFMKYTNIDPREKMTAKMQSHIDTLNKYTDRGALMGRLIGKTLKFGGDSSASFFMRKGRDLGSTATLLFSGIEAGDNLGVQLMSWSRLGYSLSEYTGGRWRAAMTAAGAGIGVARYLFAKGDAVISGLLSDDETNHTYIPEETRKVWEMNEYFDRLTYLKYMGLFEKAAEIAKDEEGIDIKAILLSQQKEYATIKEEKRNILEHIEELVEVKTLESQKLQEELKMRYKKLDVSRVPITGGDYTKSAIMYYNAARATMFALDENSMMSDIIRALPKTERSFFMEFMKERSEEKRKEILETVSPQLQKALKGLWYGEWEEPESNESYFADKELPGYNWFGWNPNVDLADVQARVVKNEGMQASAFGIYSSQYRDADVINAPNLEYSDDGDGYILTSWKLSKILEGAGLDDADVNVEPSEDGALQVFANVARVAPYVIEKEIERFFDELI